MTKEFDLVILGSGATAFAAALRAAELGKTAAITEWRTLGGTCVNRGCLPSKNLLEAAKLFYDSNHPRYPGLVSASMGLDFKALIEQKNQMIHDYRDKKYQSIITDSETLEVVMGRARFVGPHQVSIGNDDLKANVVLIATGSSPTIPELPGLSSTPYLTSDLLSSCEDREHGELKELPESLICVGGGYIALEIGQMFSRFGSRVTVLEKGPQILPRYEPEITQCLNSILCSEGITVLTDAKVQRVQGDHKQVSVHVEVKGRQRELVAACLLVATGRSPNTENLGLETVGVEVDERGFVKVDEELRTSARDIFAAGDVIDSHAGSQMATPVGAQDGGIAVGNALNHERRLVDHKIVPRAIFTDPQLGVVGLTDEEARAHGYECECQTVPMSLVPRANVVRNTRGLIKMVTDRKTQRVLGISMLGLNAAEVIHEAAMGMRFGAKVADFTSMLHAFPTMSEALKIVALSFSKDVSKRSCCAE